MKLPALELEVLRYINDNQTATAPQVHNIISQQRDTAYSTIKTAFDRLEKRGAIYRKSQVGRTTIYAPKVDSKEVQESLLSDFVKKVFQQDKTALFNALIRDTELSAQEIEYLDQLIKNKQTDDADV